MRSRIQTTLWCQRIAALLFLILNVDTITVDGEVMKHDESIQPPLPPLQGDSSSGSNHLIVCAVDGSVYTLNAVTGDVRGHFRSGSSLVAASGAQDWDERIVPGLDGRLYTLKDDEGPQLRALPITVMDILQNPMRTCREGERDCGIVTATKSASLYAFDSVTGVLQWKSNLEEEEEEQHKRQEGTQEQHDTESVVLQREDFVVRHISASTGGELWNVSVGHYLALDFDEEPSHRKLHMRQEQMPGREEPVLLRDEGELPSKAKLPAVAFSEDGLSVLAIEDTSGTILWQRKLESVVASVYAISDNAWVPLRVLDEQDFMRFGGIDIWNSGVTAALPSSSTLKQDLGLVDRRKPREPHKYFKKLLKQEIPSYMLPPVQPSEDGALVLYDPPDVKGLLRWKTRLSRQDSTLFVQSSASLHETCLLSPDGFCRPHSGKVYSHGSFDNTQKLLPSPADLPTIQVPETPVQHGGLFLTWPMVVSLVVFLIGAAAAMRIYYVRQKRKWAMQLATPPLLPTNPNSNEEAEEDDGLPKSSAPFSLGGNVRSEMTHSDHPKNYLEKFSSSPNTPVINKKTMTRSMSLPTFYNGVIREFTSPEERTKSDRTTDNTALSTAATPPLKGATGTAAAVSSAKVTTPSPPASSPSFGGVGKIGGIPLVRYSRYREDFKELSPLGKGGFGTVFRCKNAIDGGEYAVKKILIKSRTDAFGNVTKEFSQRLQRVLREVKILALLDHPNIVRYYTAWLELEEEGAMDDASSSEYTTTADKNKMARCFSSDLLTTGPETQNWQTSPGRSKRGQASVAARYAKAKATKKEVLSNNPLGCNNFMTDGNSFDSFRRRTSIDDEEDIGFTFERSGSGLGLDKIAESKSESVSLPVVRNGDDEDSSDSESQSSSSSNSTSDNNDFDTWNSSDEGSETKAQTKKATTTDNGASESRVIGNGSKTAERRTGTGRSSFERSSMTSQVRHILYIQMQLCSQKSLSDFLSNPESRKGDAKSADDGAVDIPYALGLFSQIAQGVKHVHQQGLIHRDLKPANCFIDDSGMVKVGDFGLSRESSTGSGEDGAQDGEGMMDSFHALGGHDDNTAGVGTRSYASPEQMNGSDYDASTDVYSLGIMLFEMCYPMYTGMERHIVFEGLRKRSFPDCWHQKVAAAFPSLHSLLLAMLSSRPLDRPSAADVAKRIESLLGEYTVLSLDTNRRLMENSVLLRVEASSEEGVLPRTIKLIKDAAPDVNIVQYGLRGEESKSIMEFALSSASDSEETSGDTTDSDQESSLRRILKEMERSNDIILARQVSRGRH